MLVLSAAEMQACDRATTEQHGIPSLQLMRTAGAAVAQLVQQIFPRAKRVTALCGRGNNGGDGMIAARLLTNAGFEVTTLLLGDPERLSADTAKAWNELLKTLWREQHMWCFPQKPWQRTLKHCAQTCSWTRS